MGKIISRKFLSNTLMVLAALAVLWPRAVTGAEKEITSVRTGRHDSFHRLVVELNTMAEFSVDAKDDLVNVRLFGARPGKTLGKPGTTLLTVERVYQDKNEFGPFTNVEVSVKEDSEVRHRVVLNPFRIVVDVYPPADKPAPSAAEKTIEKKSPPAEKAAPRPSAPVAAESAPEPQKPGDEKEHRVQPDEAEDPAQGINPYRVKGLSEDVNYTTLFNDGWRWEYRKKAVRRLKAELAPASAEPRVVASELGLSASTPEEVITGARSLAKTTEDPGRRAVLRAAVDFYAGAAGPDELTRALRDSKDKDLKRLGYYLLGSYYEKKNFVPEAMGYYSRATGESAEGAAALESLFRKGVSSFFRNRFDEAAEILERSMDEGHPLAPRWLANVMVLKGRPAYALRLYSGVRRVEPTDVDSVTLMSLADAYAAKEEFNKAREVLTHLASRRHGEELLESIFILKKGDTYLAEGKTTEAVEVYLETRKGTVHEGWAVSSLALADVLAAHDSTSSLKQAEAIYGSITSREYLSTEYALINLAKVQANLGKFGLAMANLEKFNQRYPVSALRGDVRDLAGEFTFRWMARMYEEENYYGVAKLGSSYALHIPFGKKADGFLMTGKAYVELGLYPDAVGSLKVAAKVGRGKVGEEATVLLAEIYLEQRDPVAALRLLDHYHENYPKATYADRAKGALAKASFMEGDFERVAALPTFADEADLVFAKAWSLARLGRHKEALGLYSRAAELFADQGRALLAAEALVSRADSDYALGRLTKAVEGYDRALELSKEPALKEWALYRKARAYYRLGRTGDMDKALEGLKQTGGTIGAIAGVLQREVPEVF